jgi:hypothetical protein
MDGCKKKHVFDILLRIVDIIIRTFYDLKHVCLYMVSIAYSISKYPANL